MSKIFISYAREDVNVATRLYADLQSLKGEPWLDIYDLVPGEGWRGAIKQAMRRSSHVLCLVSQFSAKKRGVVQLEIRDAIELARELPPDEILIIPIRLDDTIPTYPELQQLQWLDLHPSYDVGFAKLAKVLRTSGGIPGRRSRRSTPASRDVARLEGYRSLFDRQAFRVPCIFEGTLADVDLAATQILAAMATGTVLSTSGAVLTTVARAADFESTHCRGGLTEVNEHLQILRRDIASLQHFLTTGGHSLVEDGPYLPIRIGNLEFILCDLLHGGRLSIADLRAAFELLDRIDSSRNTVLKQLNILLASARQPLLSLITTSSEQVRRSAELEESSQRQRWGDYYLRMHRILREALVDSDTSA